MRESKPDKRGHQGAWIAISSARLLWFRLSGKGLGRRFQIRDRRKILASLSVPRNFFPSDLGAWATSALLSSAKNITAYEMRDWKRAIDEYFCIERPVVTICLGRESAFCDSTLFHLSACDLTVMRTGIETVVTAAILDNRYSRRSRSDWTFTFISGSSESAQILEEKLKRRVNSIITFDNQTLGIIAQNQDLLESIGFTLKVVNKIAVQKGIRLRPIDGVRGIRLSFQIKTGSLAPP